MNTNKRRELITILTTFNDLLSNKVNALMSGYNYSPNRRNELGRLHDD